MKNLAFTFLFISLCFSASLSSNLVAEEQKAEGVGELGLRVAVYPVVNEGDLEAFRNYQEKVGDALLVKDFQAALGILDREEKRYQECDDLSGLLVVTAMRSAICEWQGKPREAVKLIEELPLEKYRGQGHYVAVNMLLGATCLRAGEYELAVEAMTRQIEKLNEQIVLADESEAKELASMLCIMLSQCHYHRCLARYLMGDIDRALVSDFAQSVKAYKQANLPESLEWAVRKLYKPYFDPLSLALTTADGKGAFLIVPRENQIPFELKRGEKNTVNTFFQFDIKYLPDVQGEPKKPASKATTPTNP